MKFFTTLTLIAASSAVSLEASTSTGETMTEALALTGDQLSDVAKTCMFDELAGFTTKYGLSEDVARGLHESVQHSFDAGDSMSSIIEELLHPAALDAGVPRR